MKQDYRKEFQKLIVGAITEKYGAPESLVNKHIKQNQIIRNVMKKFRNILLAITIVILAAYISYIFTTNDAGLELSMKVLTIFTIFYAIIWGYLYLSQNIGAWVLTSRKERKEGMDWWIFLEAEEIMLKRAKT